MHNHQEIQSIPAHTAWVTAVAFSLDGQLLATASADKTVKLWTLRAPGKPRKSQRTSAALKTDITAKLLYTMAGHTADVTAVSFSPNGAILATASTDKTIKLWAVDTGKAVQTLMGHTASVFAVAFGPGGALLASASADETVKVWSVPRGTLDYTLSGHTSSVLAVAFSPDAHTIASGSADRTIKLWALQDGAGVRTLADHALLSPLWPFTLMVRYSPRPARTKSYGSGRLRVAR